MHHDILALDIAGTPVRWIGAETAAGYYASGKIAWELGDAPIHLRGGFNHAGLQSALAIAPIVAVRAGQGTRDFTVRNRVRNLQVPRVSRRLLFARDRHLCAYCGEVRHFSDLSMDHLVPASRGGRDTWSNLVTACRPCNQRKANRTPDEARRQAGAVSNAGEVQQRSQKRAGGGMLMPAFRFLPTKDAHDHVHSAPRRTQVRTAIRFRHRPRRVRRHLRAPR